MEGTTQTPFLTIVIGTGGGYWWCRCCGMFLPVDAERRCYPCRLCPPVTGLCDLEYALRDEREDSASSLAEELIPNAQAWRSPRQPLVDA
jgi:hypothetical protein